MRRNRWKMTPWRSKFHGEITFSRPLVQNLMLKFDLCQRYLVLLEYEDKKKDIWLSVMRKTYTSSWKRTKEGDPPLCILQKEGDFSRNTSATFILSSNIQKSCYDISHICPSRAEISTHEYWENVFSLWADRGFVPPPPPGGFLQTYLIWKSII